MDSDRNPWECWQGDSAGSHLTDSTGGEEEFLLSFTTPHCSVPNSDWQTPGGEPWQELELDQLISWLNRDLEDHDQRNADFRSQFQTELDGNSHASSAESWKNFSVAGDGGDGGVATTAPGPENLGVCSLLATQGPSPERNQNIAIDKMKNSRTGRRHRGPNWSLQENRYFLQHTEVEVQKGGKPPWKAISVGLTAMGFVREAKACEDHWGVLLADLKKFETHYGSDNILRDQHFWPSVGTMSREQRSQNGLPLVFDVEWFEAIARIVEERSKHRKPRRESSEGRIHVAGTPAPSSRRRQQSRVCAAPATPSSEIFDNPVGDGDGDGISRLVKLLGSNDRNVTIDQTIEVMRIGLEERKMDLRRQEIELERDRMFVYQCQRNELKEKARRPSSRCPRMELKRKSITPLQE